MKWVIFAILVLSNAYVCIELAKTRHEMAYQKVMSDRTIQDINQTWLANQNTIDRQYRFIQELSKDCGAKELKRGLTEEDLMGR